jgi:predicted metal-dependent peptidase
MDDNAMARALAEIKGILAALGYTTDVTVIACDAAVHTSKRIMKASQVQLLGGGGTNMSVGIEHAANLRPVPNVIIVITDGYTPWPDKPPRVPVIVAAIADGPTPSWATRVEVEG